MYIRLQTIKHAGLLLLLVLAAAFTPLHGQQKLPVRVAMGDVSINKVPHLVYGAARASKRTHTPVLQQPPREHRYDV